jgi:hypothetical protein
LSHPICAAQLRSRVISSFARLIVYDKPGTGLSDPISYLPTLDE